MPIHLFQIFLLDKNPHFTINQGEFGPGFVYACMCSSFFRSFALYYLATMHLYHIHSSMPPQPTCIFLHARMVARHATPHQRVSSTTFSSTQPPCPGIRKQTHAQQAMNKQILIPNPPSIIQILSQKKTEM
jgi:hypothetical protein